MMSLPYQRWNIIVVVVIVGMKEMKVFVSPLPLKLQAL